MKSRMEETNHVDDENQVMDESDEDVSGEGESNSDEEIAPADQVRKNHNMLKFAYISYN